MNGTGKAVSQSMGWVIRAARLMAIVSQVLPELNPKLDDVLPR
jgi:hypothetical protein